MTVSHVDHLRYDLSCVEWNVKPYLPTPLVVEVPWHDSPVVND